MERKVDKPDANRDPITDEPGAHPVGTGVGAALGGGIAGAGLGVAGAAAAGGAMGAAAGPIGVVAGATIGAVVGGLAGKAVAESINPTAEEEYWRNNYQSRNYVDKGTPYSDYQAAYRYGWESRGRYRDKHFEDVETDLESGWTSSKGKSGLTWAKAKHAVRDAWERITGQSSGSSRSY